MTIKEEAIKIYFHMKNHYRRLRQVKSTINSYNSKGYAHGIQRRRPPSRYQHRRDIPSTSRSKRIEKSNQTSEEICPKEIKNKRHDCLAINREDDTNGLVRPCTRRSTNSKPLESSLMRKNLIPCELLRFLENKLNSNNRQTGAEKKCYSCKNKQLHSVSNGPPNNEEIKSCCKQENSKLVPQIAVPVPVPVPIIKLSEKTPPSSGSSDVGHCSPTSAKRGENACPGKCLIIPIKKPIIQSNPTPKTPTTSPVSSIFSSTSTPNTHNIHITLPTVSEMPENPQNSLVDVSLPDRISSRFEDHEYLRFALAITEDIIRNDLYTSKDMKRVCQSHFEANKNHLDNDRMKKQIDLLSKQLGFSLDEEGISDSRDVLKKHRQTIKSDLTCDCGSIHREIDKNYKECTCQSKTCLPFQCSHYEEEILSKSLDQNLSPKSSKSSDSFKESPGKDSLKSNPSSTSAGSAEKMRNPSNELDDPCCCESFISIDGSISTINMEDEQPQVMKKSSRHSCNFDSKSSSNKSHTKYCSTCETSTLKDNAAEPASENVEEFTPKIRVLESVSEHTEPSDSRASCTKERNNEDLGKHEITHVELVENSDHKKSPQMINKSDSFSKETFDGTSNKNSVSKTKADIVEDFSSQIAINTINTTSVTSRKKLFDSCNISPDFCSPLITEVPQKKLFESCNILPDFCSPLITEVPQRKLFEGISEENKIHQKNKQKCRMSPEHSGYPRSPCKKDKKEDKRLLDEDYDLIPERDNFKIPDITVQTGELNFNNLLLDDSYELPKKFPLTGAPYPLWFYETVATQTGSFTSLPLPTENQQEIPQKISASRESRIESQTSSENLFQESSKNLPQASSKNLSQASSKSYEKSASSKSSEKSTLLSPIKSPINSGPELELSTSSSSSASEYESQESIMNKPSSSFHILTNEEKAHQKSSFKKGSEEQVPSKSKQKSDAILPPSQELEVDDVSSNFLSESLHPYQQVYEQALLNRYSPLSLNGTYLSNSEKEMETASSGLRTVHKARHSSKTSKTKNKLDNISEERNSDSYLIHDDQDDPHKHKYSIHHTDPVLSETDSLEEGIEPYLKELNKRPLVSVTKSIEDRIHSVTDELERFRQVTEVRTVSPAEVLQETIKKNAIAEVIPKTLQVEERDIQYEFIPPTVQENETDTGLFMWRKRKPKVITTKNKDSSIILKKEPQLLLDDKIEDDTGDAIRRSLRFSQIIIKSPDSKDQFHKESRQLLSKTYSNHEMKPSMAERTDQKNNSKAGGNQEKHLQKNQLDHEKNDKPKKRVHL